MASQYQDDGKFSWADKYVLFNDLTDKSKEVECLFLDRRENTDWQMASHSVDKFFEDYRDV